MQVDTQRALAAVLLDVVDAALILELQRGHVPDHVPARSALDLDHIRTHLGEHTRTGWAGGRACEIENPEIGKRVVELPRCQERASSWGAGKSTAAAGNDQSGRPSRAGPGFRRGAAMAAAPAGRGRAWVFAG